jgi:hypothetical protein
MSKKTDAMDSWYGPYFAPLVRKSVAKVAAAGKRGAAALRREKERHAWFMMLVVGRPTRSDNRRWGLNLASWDDLLSSYGP